jgi:SET domain-containing protein
LNDEFSVDATRAGNMAHLINHSCAPLAYSRIITVRNPGSGVLEDHVVIIAARDLDAGEAGL